MTLYVVDASVVAKWFFPEEFSIPSRRLLSSRHTLLAPDLIWSEVGNIVWKRVRRGEINTDEAAEIVGALVKLPLEVAPTQPLLGAALELAIAIDRSVYDCMYLSLAIGRHCRLVTADGKFQNSLAATPFAKHARHVTKLR
jgi:predicted nucleic acid-binding protein